eukprot:scaffold6082_cov62-Attheya_sp.AAC.3
MEYVCRLALPMVLSARELLIQIHHCQSQSLRKKVSFQEKKKKKKGWGDKVKNDKDVKNLSEDGSSIACGPCSNRKKSKNYRVVSMCHKFASGNVLNLVTESKDKNMKGKHQVGLGSFSFTTLTNKSSSTSSSSATPRSASPASLAASSMTSAATSAPLAPTERDRSQLTLIIFLWYPCTHHQSSTGVFILLTSNSL